MGAKKGDTVKVHYQGKLKDGTVFDDSNTRKEPLIFTIGQSDIIAGFDTAVEGMDPGQEKTVNIPADQAYGPHRKEMVVTVNRKELPPDLKPVVGQQLSVSQDEKQYAVVTVTGVSEDSVTLDANHPLAGQDLTFGIKLVEICPPCSCCGEEGHTH
jgi:FKBP-type peptidyl-prolyl cis-trans isomerase 2